MAFVKTMILPTAASTNHNVRQMPVGNPAIALTPSASRNPARLVIHSKIPNASLSPIVAKENISSMELVKTMIFKTAVCMATIAPQTPVGAQALVQMANARLTLAQKVIILTPLKSV